MDKPIPQDHNFGVGRLINQTSSAEGSSLPPRQIGRFRVPFVTNLKVVKTDKFFGTTQFTLTWDTPILTNQLTISHFNIYVLNAIGGNTAPVGPYTAQTSPANISIPAQTVANITFQVQTVLTNGYVSDLSSSPTTTGITTADSNTVAVTSIADGTPGQLISWNASSHATAFGPGAATEIVAGNGAGALPAFKTRATLNLVLGNTSLTALGQIPYVASAGTVTALAAGAVDAILVGSGTGVAPQFKTSSTLDFVLGRSALTAVGQIPYVGAASTLATIAAGAVDSILVGSGTGVAPQFKTSSTLDFVIGRANLTTANRVALVSAAGTLTESANLTFAAQLLTVTGSATSAETAHITGLVKFAGDNTTGAGSAALGANCPAVTATGPYTWLKALSSDGSTVYIPVWK